MKIKELKKEEKKIIAGIPLSTTSGKIRVKKRNMIYDYGEPYATRQNEFTQSNYIEWQVGYDVDIKDDKKKELTSLPNITFLSYKEKTKALYELSEYIYYFFQWGIISKEEIKVLIKFLKNIKKEELIDSREDLVIKRTSAVNKNILDIDFEKLTVEYPLLIYPFKNYEIIIEIIIKEKQRASGIQPMLYFCFPITELKTDVILLGRISEKKEVAGFEFNKNNYSIILEMIKIFGILSEAHRVDIVSMLEVIVKSK